MSERKTPPSPSSRQRYLQRIRAQFGAGEERGGDERGARQGLPAMPQRKGAGTDLPKLEAMSHGDTYGAGKAALAARFIQELENLAGTAVVLEDEAALHGALTDLVAGPEPASVLLGEDDVVAACGVRSIIEASGAAVAAPGDPAASLGITGAEAAVAQTGTVVLVSQQHRGRRESLLPPHHVVLLPMKRLVSGLSGVLERLEHTGVLAEDGSGRELPSSVNFITGPSRSADLAGDLSLGVHGPGQVTVLILAWLDGDDAGGDG